MTPQVSKPATLSAGAYSGDVNLFSGDYNASINLGSVKTPGGLGYSLSLDYSSNFSVGNTGPVTSGIPYGEGWNLNIPTISVETEVFNNFTSGDYCHEASSFFTGKIDFSAAGVKPLNEGDIYWFSPYISIPGVASGRAIFKYVDVADNNTAVFELNAFEKHVEIRFDGSSWEVVADDGTRYSFFTAMQSYASPANKRVFYYDQENLGASSNIAKDVQNSGYSNSSQAAIAENAFMPKQKYNMWYCDAITHRNQPLQGINFTYQGFGKFNYFKEFEQEAFKYADAEVIGSSSFAKNQDFSCYSDLLLLKVESYSADGLADRLDLEYATDQQLINANSNELINYTATGAGRMDSLYSFRSVYHTGDTISDFTGWRRYEHAKISSLTNGSPFSNVSDPYATANGYVRSDVSSADHINFSHSFLESPRLMTTRLFPGDIYEVKPRIVRTSANMDNSGTIDLKIVSGDLGNPKGNDTTSYTDFESLTGGYYITDNYSATRSKTLYSTSNMALKWTLGYEDGNKQLSNLFVMPGIPSTYQGFHFQIGPGNSDVNYALKPAEIWDNSNVMTENSYFCKAPLTVDQPFTCKSAADISSSFGIGVPWNVVAPIYEYMVTHNDSNEYSSGSGKEAYHTWWNFNPPTLGLTYPNMPTKLDSNVQLSEFELIRYTKNPYMLTGVTLYHVNGEVGGPVTMGLKPVSKKKMEYQSQHCDLLENYDYDPGDTLKYRSDMQQVFVLLSKVREIPVSGSSSDTSKLLTTFLSYSRFHSDSVTFQTSQPLNGHSGMVLTRITDNLGGITSIEFYPAGDARTRFTTSYFRDITSCGTVATNGYGMGQSSTVHPVVKYVLKNDEDDLVKDNVASSNIDHKRWLYDFDTNSMVSKSSMLQIDDDRFYNGKHFRPEPGFTKVTVYGPSLSENGDTAVNHTIYTHIGSNFDVFIDPDTNIFQYLFHGKLAAAREYDVNNKLFSEKLYSYGYTLAYKNGYVRPDFTKENIMWDQSFDEPGGQYEYRDYYLNTPMEIEFEDSTYTDTAAYQFVDIPAFNGSGDDREYPKFLEFYFYQSMADNELNPDYLFHSYFIKKQEETDRKYDDYLFKSSIGSLPAVPASPSFNPNPFGTGHVNPAVYDQGLLTAQLSLINNSTDGVIYDSLLSQSPLQDTTLMYAAFTENLSIEHKVQLLLAQNGLSNPVLYTTTAALMGFPENYAFDIIDQQPYISDSILIEIAPLVKGWDEEFVNALYLRNDYLSDTVVMSIVSPASRLHNGSLTEILSVQPQFQERTINTIINFGRVDPAALPSILRNQVLTDSNYYTLISNSNVADSIITAIIETGNKFPDSAVFSSLMARTPAFSSDEMERIIAAADRDIDTSTLNALKGIYGSLPFLVNFVFRGNPLDAYCNNEEVTNWNCIETKTTYEYYEADYRGISNGRAYKVLMGLEDVPGRVVHGEDIFDGGETITVNNVRLKHEPSWQVFSITKKSTHLPTAKDEQQFFYLYDLKNRYDRYWYNYDLDTVNGQESSFSPRILHDNEDTLMYTFRWDDYYTDSYVNDETPVSPKYDGQIKSRQYGMRSTAFQQLHCTKNQRDADELKKSEYYFYDARWSIDVDMADTTISYSGPECPSDSTSAPTGCDACVYRKTFNETELLSQLQIGYCLWHVPESPFYFICPSSVDYSECSDAYELVNCSTTEASGGGDPEKDLPPGEALSKVLELRSTIIQIDTVPDLPSTDFSHFCFDRSNTEVADFYMVHDGQDANGFDSPYRMLFPYDTLTTMRILRRNRHLQPAIISNAVGLKTRFYYDDAQFKFNVDSNCTNSDYSYLYDYNSIYATNIGLPVRVTVGYQRADSLVTTFTFTDDGQVKTMISPSGHKMSYDFDGYNRMVKVTENDTNVLSTNVYNYWQHDFAKSFAERTEENYVLASVFQNSTDTVYGSELQKAYVDPLNRNTGAVKAYYIFDKTVNISSGFLTFDNWGRPVSTLKTYRQIDDVNQGPVRYVINPDTLLHSDVKYDPDPASLDVRHSDPGITITDNHTIKKETHIVNNVIASCELGLTASTLHLIMNSGATSGFRFLRTSVKDQDDKETVTYTNAFGQLVGSISWVNMTDKAVTLYVYDSYGNLEKTINALKQETDYEYNILGQLIRESNVDGGEKRYIYNRHGKISAVQDRTDRNNYDNTGLWLPRYRRFAYDIYGNLTSQSLATADYRIDPFCFKDTAIGETGDYYYDSLDNPNYFRYTFSNRMTQDWLNSYKTLWNSPTLHIITIDNLDESTDFALTDIAEKTMQYGTLQASPSTLGKLAQSQSYDLSGSPIQRINYSYDVKDRLASQDILQHPTNVALTDTLLVKATIDYTYNFRGSVLNERLDMGSDDTTDMDYYYSYDALNRLTTVSAAQGVVSAPASATLLAHYSYDDARGTISSKTYNVSGAFASVQTVFYSYDDRDRLTGINSSLLQYQLFYDGAIVPGYTGSGPDGMSYDHCYNGNVNGIRVGYGFSGAANAASTTLFSKPTSYGYKYDKMNRLTSANASVGTFIDAQFANGLNDTPEDSYSIGDESYKYDKIGNILMLSRTLQDTSIALGNGNDEFAYAYATGTNRLTGIVNSPNTTLNRSYTYDDNGNLLTDDFRHLESTVYGRSSYAYSIAKPSDEDIEYLYDHNDQRVFKKDVTSAQTTLEYYIKDAMGRDLAIVRSVTTDTTGAVATEFYAYGSDRIAKINAGSSSSDTTITGTEVTFFLSDHLGNNRVAFSLDSSNTIVIVNAMDYFPYGKILREFDNGNGNRFLTTQHERDKETGLDYRGARYYDSDVARFLSLDPLAAKYPAWSAYNYVMGNPVKLIDPNGKEVETDPPGKKKSILNILPKNIALPQAKLPSSKPAPKQPQSNSNTSSTNAPVNANSGIMSLTTVTLGAEDQRTIYTSKGPIISAQITVTTGVSKELVKGSNSIVNIGLKRSTKGLSTFSVGANGVTADFGSHQTTVSFSIPFTNTTFDIGQDKSGPIEAMTIGYTTTNSDNSYYGSQISIAPNGYLSTAVSAAAIYIITDGIAAPLLTGL